MPFIKLDGTRIHYRFDTPLGGPADAPVVVFSNSLGTNLSMWDLQVPSLTAHFRVLRYDTRGLGLSSVTPGPYANEQLARDVVRLLDALGIERAHFCGLSMGGMAGMWLGAYALGRVDRLVLCDTAPRIGSAEFWRGRISSVLEGGMVTITEAVLERWFTPAFMSRAPEAVEQTRQMLLQSPPEGYVACCAAVRDTDETQTLDRIRARTLVITGRHDPATPPADGRYIAGKVPGAHYVELEASHLSNIEAAPEFNQALLGFLTSPESN
ncbi:MAG TPA: 3-oxoadipate enol-lactonase [Terriglobia bacterium]